MPRPYPTQAFTCVSCELEIDGAPTFHLGLAFCCAGCAANGPCTCSYDRESVDASRVRHCHDVMDPTALPKPTAERPAWGTGRR